MDPTEVYDNDNDSEAGTSVVSASSESVVVIETLEIIKDIDGKGKGNIQIKKRKQIVSRVVGMYDNAFFFFYRTVRKKARGDDMW